MTSSIDRTFIVRVESRSGKNEEICIRFFSVQTIDWRLYALEKPNVGWYLHVWDMPLLDFFTFVHRAGRFSLIPPGGTHRDYGKDIVYDKDHWTMFFEDDYD